MGIHGQCRGLLSVGETGAVLELSQVTWQHTIYIQIAASGKLNTFYATKLI